MTIAPIEAGMAETGTGSVRSTKAGLAPNNFGTQGMTNTNNPSPQAVEAVARVRAALARAEEEYPKLAAPDGTVAVQIADLRLALQAHASPRELRYVEALNAIIDRGPERAAKWAGMSAKDIARTALELG